MTQENLDQLIPEFKNKLFADLGLEKLPDEEKEKFLQSLNEKIINNIFNTIAINLSDEQIKNLENRLQTISSDEEKAQIVIETSKNIPDFQNKITQSLQELYEQMMETAKKYDTEHPAK